MCVSRCGAASLKTSLHESCVYQRSLIFSRGQNDKSFSAGCCTLEFSAACTGHTLCRAHVRPSSLNHLVSSTVSLTRLPSLCELFRVCESLYFSCASDSLRSLQSRMRGKLETTVASSRLALLHANIPKSRKSEGVARQYT